MANMARLEIQKREVEVKRTDLINTLMENRERHISEYQAAMDGYRNTLLEKVSEAFESAGAKLISNHEAFKDKIENLEDKDISKQKEEVVVSPAISVHMPVPRSYVEDYDAAIAIAKWEVNETMKLTYSEFTCFVRNEWDWSITFKTVSERYCG